MFLTCRTYSEMSAPWLRINVTSLTVMTEKNIFLEENKQQEFFKIKSFFSSVVFFFLAKVFKYYVCTYTYTYIPTSYNIIGSPINMYFIFTHYFLLFCRRQDAMQLLKVSNLDIYINSRSQPSTKKDNLSQSWLVILS